MKVYKTISGDFWDVIAKKVYGSESYTSFLMANNFELLDYVMFPEGIMVKVEELPKEPSTYPSWRS